MSISVWLSVRVLVTTLTAGGREADHGGAAVSHGYAACHATSLGSLSAPSPRPATRQRYVNAVPRAPSRTQPPRGTAAERIATAADWQRKPDSETLIAPRRSK